MNWFKVVKEFFFPAWKEALKQGHTAKAFSLFKQRHPALVAQHKAMRVFEAMTGKTLNRQKTLKLGQIIDFKVPPAVISRRRIRG